MSLISGLTNHNSAGNDNLVYHLDEVLSLATQVVELDAHNWLIVRASENYIEYGLFSFVAQDGPNPFVDCVFYGEGWSGALREMRHTYFGPNDKGYCFYLPLDATIKALEHLKRYFD